MNAEAPGSALLRTHDAYLDELSPQRIKERVCAQRRLDFAILAAETVGVAEAILRNEPVPASLLRPQYR